MGFEESIYAEEADIWNNAFFSLLSSGETVNDACNGAAAYAYQKWVIDINGDDGIISPEDNPLWTTDSFYIGGNKFATFA